MQGFRQQRSIGPTKLAPQDSLPHGRESDWFKFASGLRIRISIGFLSDQFTKDLAGLSGFG